MRASAKPQLRRARALDAGVARVGPLRTRDERSRERRGSQLHTRTQAATAHALAEALSSSL
eukprot:2568379-Pleurochrysis_carterae.AAC.1